jgi:TolA-binding protein
MSLSFRARATFGLLLAVAVCSLPARADEADDRYAVAAGHYARKRWQFAAEEFRTFVDQYPGHPNASQAVFFLAEALTRLGRLDEAAGHFRDYLKREPQGRFAAPALFRVGEAAYLCGKLDLAKPELERFLNTYPDHELNAYLLAYLGDVALSGDEPAQAEDYYRRGLSRFPQGPMQDQCRFGLARALEKQGKSEEAERFYLAVAAKTASPLADDARFRLGALQYAGGRLNEALETFAPFESTLAGSPWQSTARLGRGWALVKLGRVAEAKSVFQSLASDPKLGVEARYWLGLTQKVEEDWDAAARTLLEAATDHPQHQRVAALRFHAGDCLLHAGKPAEADEQFDQVIASSPGDNVWVDDALRGKVQAAFRTKDDEALDRQAAEFAARFPDSPLKADVQRLLARSLLQRKQYERAVEVLEPLVKAGDDEEPVPEDRYFLSLAYEGLERHQEALDMLLPVIGSDAEALQVDAQAARASLLMKLQRFDEAIAPLETLLSMDPGDAQLASCLGNLAICYAETDELEKAKARYAELLKKYPNHEVITPTTEQLAEAVYEAGEMAWADTLFTWLATGSGASEHRVKGLSGLGWSQYRRGELEEAAASFDRLLKEDPDPATAAEAALVRGRILQQLGDHDPALAMYDLVVQRYPESKEFPEALWAAALLRDSLGADREAADLYQRLATDYPQFPEIDAVLYYWAWVLRDLKREAESSELFDRLRREHPASSYRADAAFRLAQHALEKKDHEQARLLVAEVLAAEPSQGLRENAVYLDGQIASAQKRWDEARRAFETLVNDYPQSSLRLMAEYGIAEATFRQNDYEAAGERLDRLVQQTAERTEPWLAVIHLRRAQVLCHQKQWDEAYQIASTIAPKYPHFEEQYEVDYVIGRCLSNRGEFGPARDAYRRVIQSEQGAKTETAAKAQLMIAESFYHQKNYQQALREYLALEILYDYPTWQAAAVFQAAKCHEMLGEWKQAAEEYARLLADYPNTSLLVEAKERLQAAKEGLEEKK